MNRTFLSLAALLFAASPVLAGGMCVPEICTSGDCTVDLFGGQTIDAGDVTYSNDDQFLFIQINTEDDWQFDTLHIYVGVDPVPTNGGGNPSPGQFPVKLEFSSPMTSHTQMFQLSEFAIDPTDPNCDEASLHIVVHAELENSVTGQEETGFAWGDIEFPGKRWGWSACYGVPCDEPPTDCDPFTQTDEEFDLCCELNPTDPDCEDLR